jgi:hypothetical protein
VAAVLRSKTREAVAPLTKNRKRRPRAALWKLRPERALKALGQFLSNPILSFLHASALAQSWKRFTGFAARAIERRAVHLPEVCAEMTADFRYLPEACWEGTVALFGYLEFVPNWILSPRWRQRCSAAWGRHRQTYDSLMHWLRGPLPF